MYVEESDMISNYFPFTTNSLSNYRNVPILIGTVIMFVPIRFDRMFNKIKRTTTGKRDQIPKIPVRWPYR